MARVPTPTRFVVGWTCQRESRVLAYDPADACTRAVPRQSWSRNIHGALGSSQGVQLAAGRQAGRSLGDEPGCGEQCVSLMYMQAGRHRCFPIDVAAMHVANTGALVYHGTREREEMSAAKA